MCAIAQSEKVSYKQESAACGAVRRRSPIIDENRFHGAVDQADLQRSMLLFVIQLALAEANRGAHHVCWFVRLFSQPARCFFSYSARNVVVLQCAIHLEPARIGLARNSRLE